MHSRYLALIIGIQKVEQNFSSCSFKDRHSLPKPQTLRPLCLPFATTSQPSTFVTTSQPSTSVTTSQNSKIRPLRLSLWQLIMTHVPNRTSKILLVRWIDNNNTLVFKIINTLGQVSTSDDSRLTQTAWLKNSVH